MKFVIISVFAILLVSNTLSINSSTKVSHDIVSGSRLDNSKESDSNKITKIKSDSIAIVQENTQEKQDIKNLKIKESKRNTSSKEKIMARAAKIGDSKGEIKSVENHDVYYAKCFIRFGNDFYDMSRIPEITINADTENGARDFRINLCRDISTSCPNTGLGLQEKDCLVIAGDQKLEKTWLTDGKYFI